MIESKNIETFLLDEPFFLSFENGDYHWLKCFPQSKTLINKLRIFSINYLAPEHGMVEFLID